MWRNVSGQGGDGCNIYDVDWDNFDVSTIDSVEVLDFANDPMRPCETWEFDQTDFQSTITSDFNLVCGRDYLTSLAQTLYFVGMVAGVFTFGVLSDIYGRKKVLVPILLAMSVSGIITSQMPTYLTFTIARVFNAFIVILLCRTS